MQRLVYISPKEGKESPVEPLLLLLTSLSLLLLTPRPRPLD